MRLIKLSFLFLVLLVSKPVSAQSVIDQITGQLRAQGFSKIEVSDTWLGRARIEAKSRDWEREIIVNPRTGEILRDYSESRGSSNGGRSQSGPGLLGATGRDDRQNRGRGGDSNSDGDSDGDDSDHDSSGHGGSGNSGSGNSGSGNSGGDSDSDSDSDSDGGGDD